MAASPRDVEKYLNSLPDDRRHAIEAIRKVIAKSIDRKFEEGIQYGMLGWHLPHSVYPNGYHCDPKQPLPFASLASQKNHIGLYLFCIYCDAEEEQRFREEWLATGKKLDMGKSCVRVKKLEDVPLDVVGRALKRMTMKKFVAAYEAGLPESVKKKLAARGAGATGRVTRKTVRKVTKKTTKRVVKKTRRSSPG